MESTDSSHVPFLASLNVELVLLTELDETIPNLGSKLPSASQAVLLHVLGSISLTYSPALGFTDSISCRICSLSIVEEEPLQMGSSCSGCVVTAGDELGKDMMEQESLSKRSVMKIVRTKTNKRVDCWVLILGEGSKLHINAD